MTRCHGPLSCASRAASHRHGIQLTITRPGRHWCPLAQHVGYVHQSGNPPSAIRLLEHTYDPDTRAISCQLRRVCAPSELPVPTVVASDRSSAMTLVCVPQCRMADPVAHLATSGDPSLRTLIGTATTFRIAAPMRATGVKRA